MKTLPLAKVWWAAVASALLVGGAPAWAQDVAKASLPQNVQERSLRDWLERLYEASRGSAYIGTFVVSAGPEISASKIWHMCDGNQQVERIDTLTGVQRTTLRRNDEVMTFVHDAKVVLKEKREALRLFPDLLRAPGQQIDAWYRAQVEGVERIAGVDAVVVDFLPKDSLRYGYRLWSEKKTGLVVKLQTRGSKDRVLEQVVFTDLQLGVPLKMDALTRQMDNTKGYQVVRPQLRKTTPEAEGWRLKAEVPGFQSMGCHARVDGNARADAAPVVQWVFSDGLASVSLFLETFDPQKHTKEQSTAVGATRTLTSRVGDHWVTAMGEVPVGTLKLFVQALERTR